MVYQNAYFGEGNGTIIIDELECTGNEASIENCDARWFSHDCSHREDVGIDCLESAYPNPTTSLYKTTTRPYTTRLFTTYTQTTTTTVAPIRCPAFIPNGKMVYSCDRTLYSMCYYSCQSGCSSVSVDLYCNGYGYWDNGELACKCNGISPATTTQRPLSTAPPNFLTTAVSYITTQKYATVRLVNGTATWNGRVEVYFNGRWGTICDDWFDENDAFVICKMLGLAKYRYPVVHHKAYYGKGTGQIIIDNLGCKGSEDTIEDCSSRPWFSHNCHHSEDAGLDCHSYEYLTTTPAPRWSDWYTSTTSSSESTTTQSSVCPLFIPNGRMSDYCSRRPYSYCRIFCDKGCRSTRTYTYCVSGRWIGEQTACKCSGVTTTTKGPVSCPKYIPNGRMLWCDLQPLSLCSVSCDTGCRISTSFLRCDSSGRWLDGNTACNCTVWRTTPEPSVRCPVFIPNGYINTYEYCSRLPYSACRYECYFGCSPDFSKLRCTWNGTWFNGDTACNCRAPVLCSKEIDNGHVKDSCSRKDWANCSFDCADNCDRDPKVNSLLCRNGTWYSARRWTMDTENPCICDFSANDSVSKKTSAVTAGILCGAAFLVIIWITVCIIAIMRKRRQMSRSDGSATVTACSQQPPAYSRTRATAPRTAGITASSQRAGVQNGVSSPIYMLSNTIAYQSAQYTASQNSCYLVPEATSSNGSAYPDAPPSYSSIAAVKSEEPPPPPSYEEAVSLPTSPTT